ncbi:MAG: polysaccharide biosynthesis tyrosine autokinase [Bacteroidales bacterium]|nr:polysaccharide biosynthesis tyrosine autokinase [Bacteroidales bacterium]
MQRLPDNAPHDIMEEDVNLIKLLSPYIARWKWFVLSVLLFIIVGLLYLRPITPMYKTSATLLIKDRQAGRNSMLEELDMFSTRNVIDNEVEILYSFSLMERVVRDMELQVSYSVKRGGHYSTLYKTSPLYVELIQPSLISYKEPLRCHFTEEGELIIDNNQYPSNGLIVTDHGTLRVAVNDSLLMHWDKKETLFVHLCTVEEATSRLLRRLSVQRKNKTASVIGISITTPNPRMGVDIVNHLLEVYDITAVENKNLLINSTLQFINTRLLDVAEDLSQAEAKLEQYKISRGITNISAEAQMFLSAAQTNEVERNKVNIQLNVLQGIEDYVLGKENSPGTAPATMGINDPTLLNLIAALMTTEADRSKALHTMKASNPIAQAYDDRISNLKASILENIQALRNSLEITQEQLLSQGRRLEQQINSVPRKERELLDVSRQQEVKNQLYVYLLSKREETAISYASTVADSRIIDPARSSDIPVSPQKNRILLFFTFIGLIIPVAAIYVTGLVYNKIASKDELEKGLQAPLIGEIAFIKSASKIVAGVKRGRLAEQFRTLRSNLNFMMTAGQGLRTIMVTSSISGEGKSFLAANLGVTYASLGKRTVVLGFDLRHPGLTFTFGLENSKGLSNYLAGQCNLQEIVRPIEGHDNLHIISCGDIPPNPQELLMSPKVATLIAELQQLYDYMIIDTPPAGLLSDALLLKDYVEVVVYVMRQNYTPKDRIKLVNDFYLQKRLNNLCVVANSIKVKQWSHYYHYGYGRYEGYYFEDEERNWWRRIINKIKKEKDVHSG